MAGEINPIFQDNQVAYIARSGKGRCHDHLGAAEPARRVDEAGVVVCSRAGAPAELEAVGGDNSGERPQPISHRYGNVLRLEQAATIADYRIAEDERTRVAGFHRLDQPHDPFDLRHIAEVTDED